MKRFLLIVSTVAAAVVATLAIAAGERPGSSARGFGHGTLSHERAGLKPFGSCEHLRGYLRRHRPARGGPIAVPEGVVDDAIAGEAAAGSAPSAGPGQTNVQEEGVDEPDLVKTSGSTVFTVAGDRLRALDLSGAAPALLDSVELPDGAGAYSYADSRELLLSGDRALVISRAYDAAGARTLLTELDVTDPAQIRELATEAVDGAYVSARLSGETARVVIDAYPRQPIAERGRGRAWMPRSVLYDRVAQRKSRRRLLGCDDVRRPGRFSGTAMLTVLTVDLDRGLPAIDTDAVMSGGEIVYGSPTSLYVATERWPADPAGHVTTEIHRFDVTEPEATRYVGSGEVEGYMLSQWSMSEHDGVLRVASTAFPPWEGDAQVGESESFVTALELEDDRLLEVGRVGGLGRGEEIYAVRFIGDLGYVVTFRQVDPLYVLDLSDPSRPRKLGELKIPGYSAYLHPVGEDLLLGVGQDATEEGQTTGVAVSLFDVSDPSSPQRLDRERLGSGTYTEVEYDHHAFAYWTEQRLAVVPLEAWSESDGSDFYGAVGIRVDPVTGLEATARTSQGESYEFAIRRTLLIGGRLFSVSDRGVAEHDPVSLARLAFTPYAGS